MNRGHATSEEQAAIPAQMLAVLQEEKEMMARLLQLAGEDDRLQDERMNLSRERTRLTAKLVALIRTSLALVTLGAGLMRLFGFGWRTVLDFTLIASGILMFGYSARVYLAARGEAKALKSEVAGMREAISEYAPADRPPDDESRLESFTER